MAFHVPAVSMAMWQNMCVLAKLAYFEIFCCAAWSAKCVGNMRLCICVWNSDVPCQWFAFSPREEGSITIITIFIEHTNSSKLQSEASQIPLDELRMNQMCKATRIITMWRVDAEIDGNVRDAFVFPRYTVCFIFDFFPKKIKISKNATLAVNEFSIFYRIYTSNILQTGTNVAKTFSKIRFFSN